MVTITATTMKENYKKKKMPVQTGNTVYLLFSKLCHIFAHKFSQEMTKFEIEEKIVEMLKTVFDPEIPVNVYDLGLIYKIDLADDGIANIDMTLTAPNCPAADFIADDIKEKVNSIEGVKDANINIVFEPEWNQDMMSDEAKLELGFL